MFDNFKLYMKFILLRVLLYLIGIIVSNLRNSENSIYVDYLMLDKNKFWKYLTKLLFIYDG